MFDNHENAKRVQIRKPLLSELLHESVTRYEKEASWEAALREQMALHYRHLEEFAAAYLQKTSIDPQRAELVEVRESPTMTRWFYRERDDLGQIFAKLHALGYWVSVTWTLNSIEGERAVARVEIRTPQGGALIETTFEPLLFLTSFYNTRQHLGALGFGER